MRAMASGSSRGATPRRTAPTSVLCTIPPPNAFTTSGPANAVTSLEPTFPASIATAAGVATPSRRSAAFTSGSGTAVRPSPSANARLRSTAASDTEHALGVPGQHHVRGLIGEWSGEAGDVLARVGPQRDAVRIVGGVHRHVDEPRVVLHEPEPDMVVEHGDEEVAPEQLRG